MMGRIIAIGTFSTKFAWHRIDRCSSSSLPKPMNIFFDLLRATTLRNRVRHQYNKNTMIRKNPISKIVSVSIPLSIKPFFSFSIRAELIYRPSRCPCQIFRLGKCKLPVHAVCHFSILQHIFLH